MWNLRRAAGIYQPGLFRAVPNRIRLARLKEAFDLCAPICALSPDLDEMCPRMTPTLSTTRASLRKESMPDICALLKNYLDLLPGPLLDANLAAALHMLCVQPSLTREEAEAESTDSGSDGGYFASHARARSAPSPSHPATSPADVPMTPSEHRDALLLLEAPQVLLAQHLLRLAPPPALALLAYLLGFFTQLPLCPDNGMGFADVARMFGRVLVGGADAGVVRGCVHWLLERWARISDGLFDVAAGEDAGPVHVESAPATACRSTFDAFSRSPPLSSNENTPKVRQGEGAGEEGEVGLARMQMPYDPGLLERGYRPHSTSVSSNSSTATTASLESEDMSDLDTPYTFGSAKDGTYVEEAQPGVMEYEAPFDAFERSPHVTANYALGKLLVVVDSVREAPADGFTGRTRIRLVPSITAALRTRYLRRVRRRRSLLSLTVRAIVGHRELVGVLLRLDVPLLPCSPWDDQPPLGAQLVGGVPRLGLRVVRGAL